MKPDVRRAMVLFMLAFLFMAASLYPLSIVCYALLGALLKLSGETKKAIYVALWAGVSALIVLNSFMEALALAAGATMGLVLAWSIERRWSYGWQLTLTAGAGIAASVSVMLWKWEALRHDATILSNQIIASMQQYQNLNPAETASQQQTSDQAVEAFRWLDLNYPYVAVGFNLGYVLILAAVMISLLERWQRAPEAPARRKPTGFQRMRVPDWVVWIAIAAALMWFVDSYYRPDPVLRAISWNTGLALLFLYLLNGVSILLYALTIFKASAFVGFMVMSGIMLFGMWPMLGIFGLFDTWYDFRMRFRRIAMLRRVSYRPDDQDS